MQECMYERKKNDQRTNKRMNEQANELINANLYTARKHLRTKVTPDLHLISRKRIESTYTAPSLYIVKMGKPGVGIKNDIFRYFSIKSYVVDVY